MTKDSRTNENPEDELIEIAEQVKATAVDWLTAQPNSGGNGECKLRVQRTPRPAREFTGVVLRTLVSPKIVELRVRPEGSDKQWICFFECSDADRATGLFETARHEAADVIIGNYLVDDKLLVGEATSAAVRSAVTSMPRQIRAQAYLNPKGSVVEKLRKSKLQELASRLNEALNRKGMVAGSDILTALRSTINDKVREDSVRHVLHLLLLEGVLEPKLGPQFINGIQFVAGVYMPDLVEEYAAVLRAAEVERIRKEIKGIRGARQQQKHILADARAKVASIEAGITKLDSDEAQRMSRHKELTGLDYGE